jgi:nucleoside-diphosphate-sugar epimerase
VTRGLVAVTGATGFLGQHLVRALADAGWSVRLLARRAPLSTFWSGIEPQIVPGGLEDPATLRRLCQGADAIVHNAGLIAGSAAQLHAVNVEGVRRLAEAARTAPDAPVILVSSLAARAPELSAYAASKRAGEDAARQALGQALTIVRPPAIYGPGDRETLRFFQLAAVSPVLPVLDPKARIALIHAQDAARQIVALTGRTSPGGLFALSDCRPEGYSWRELMKTAAAVVGRPRLMLRVPAMALFALAAAAVIGDGWRRKTATLTFGKVRELTHKDWGIRPDERVMEAPEALFDLTSGFQHTFEWYRNNAWL